MQLILRYLLFNAKSGNIVCCAHKISQLQQTFFFLIKINSRSSESAIVRSSELDRPCLGLFPYIPMFFCSGFLTSLSLLILSVSSSFTIILVSGSSSSCLTFVVHMRKVFCVGYTPHARDTRSQRSMLIGSPFISVCEKLVFKNTNYCYNLFIKK